MHKLLFALFVGAIGLVFPSFFSARVSVPEHAIGRSAHALAQIRSALHLSSDEMAKDLGVSCNLLSEIENEKMPIGMDLADRIQDTYGIVLR